MAPRRNLVVLKRTTIILTFTLLTWISAAGAQEGDPGIAVLDTGTNAVGLNIAEGFNFVNGTTDISDNSSNNHGTSVSQIINQEAPGIPQYQFVVDGTNPASSDAALRRAASDPAIRVISLSTSPVRTPSAALPEASAAGKFVAVRTGNDALDNPNTAAVAANGLAGVAIVTGTDGAGAFLPSSNACGVTADRCVGVRGTTEFNNIFGTSFAAARLAGIAVAVLKAAPFLSHEDLAQVLFATATDTGDPRLGHGFIANAEQVINSPAGPTSVGGGGGSGGLAAAALVVGAAAGAALLIDNDEELEKTLVLDSFGRPFHVDLSELSRIDDQRGSLTRFFDSLEQRHDQARIQLDDVHTLQAAYVTSDLGVVDPGKYFAFDDDPAFRDTDIEWALSLAGAYENGFHYQLDRNRDPSSHFGVMNGLAPAPSGSRAHFLSGQSFSVPLLGFGSVADSVSFGYQDQDGFGLGMGLVSTNEDRAHGRNSVSGLLEGSYRFDDRAEITLQVGRLQEDGSLFGGSSNGAFSVDNTDTLAASISATLRLGKQAYLVGNYGVARSDVDQSDSGLLRNFSSVRSDWFGVGVVADEVFSTGDQMGVAFSQPLRVTEGEVDLDVPHARDFEGNIYRDSRRISLEPGGREYTLESYYLHPLGRRASIGAYVMLRHDHNHVADSGTDMTFLASYRAKF